MQDSNIKFLIIRPIPNIIFLLFLLILIFSSLSLLCHHRESSILMSHNDLAQIMVVQGIVDLLLELVIAIHVERLLLYLFLFHQVRIVLIDPFDPAIAVDEDQMLRGQDEI